MSGYGAFSNLKNTSTSPKPAAPVKETLPPSPKQNGYRAVLSLAKPAQLSAPVGNVKLCPSPATAPPKAPVNTATVESTGSAGSTGSTGSVPPEESLPLHAPAISPVTSPASAAHVRLNQVSSYAATLSPAHSPLRKAVDRSSSVPSTIHLYSTPAAKPGSIVAVQVPSPLSTASTCASALQLKPLEWNLTEDAPAAVTVKETAGPASGASAVQLA